MNPLKTFNILKEKLSKENFYKYCKMVVRERDIRAKIVVQKALQFIDNYITNNKNIAL